MGETNVERLVNRWETDGIGRGEWNTQAICRALRAAIEADRDQPPEGAVRVWLTHEGDTSGVYVREVINDGKTHYRPENATALKLKPGESVEGVFIPTTDRGGDT